MCKSGCPVCKSDLGFRDIHRIGMNFLNKLEVKCTQEECPEKDHTMKYEDFLTNHI